MKKQIRIILISAFFAMAFGLFPAESARTETTESILTLDKTKTRIGTLHFHAGFPSQETVRKVYENLDFMRGVEVFLNTCQGASLAAMRKGMRSVGAKDGTVLLFENAMNANTLFLTANTDTVYALVWLDLRKGPIILAPPPETQGVINDFWARHIIDIGNAGRHKNKNEKIMILPPDHKAKAPAGYLTARSRTYGVCVMLFGLVPDGNPQPVSESFRNSLKIYEPTQAEQPPKLKFINGSGKILNTLHPTDISFYQEVNTLVQEEPSDSLSPELLGLLSAIGIEKGHPFNPDDRMKKILEEAATVGNATARTIEFRPRDSQAWYYPAESTWTKALVGDNHEFLRNGARDLDARTLFHYGHNFATPALVEKTPGKGWQYAVNSQDSEGNPLDGSKRYKLILPPDVPAGNFWSIVVYDPQTRSMLATDHPSSGLSSSPNGPVPKKDGSFAIYFGPKPPKGKKRNWIKTDPDKGFWLILRLHEPLEPWFNKTWRPGEIELIKPK